MLSCENAHSPLDTQIWRTLIDQWIDSAEIGRRVVLIPPDFTRRYSYAGEITVYLYQRLHERCELKVLPAVGTHLPLGREEQEAFFPGIPEEAFLAHCWQTDSVSLGQIPAALVRELSEGLYDADIDVEINRCLTDGSFDTILSIGQVVPHEIVGMANYTKNLLVGVGGKSMINHSHMIGALYGIERTLGQVQTPVRALFDEAQKRYLNVLPVTYFQTVTRECHGQAYLHGLFISRNRQAFEAAAALSAQVNIVVLPERQKKIVAYLEPGEFKSTWVGNKAIYRTRKAIADGGELLVIAPGLYTFGENELVDRAIRQYGYCGTEKIRRLYEARNFDGLEMVAAHLMQASTDGRFHITYATDPARISAQEIQKAGFGWMDVYHALAQYRPEEKETGYYRGAEEEYYFVKAPATGLWQA